MLSNILKLKNKKLKNILSSSALLAFKVISSWSQSFSEINEIFNLVLRVSNLKCTPLIIAYKTNKFLTSDSHGFNRIWLTQFTIARYDGFVLPFGV